VKPSAPRASDQPDVIRNFEPATGHSLPPVPVMTPEAVHETIRRARQAQPAWAALSFEARRRKLMALNRIILERTDELCDIISRETGKPRIEALLLEVIPAADFTFYYARRAKKLLRPEKIRLRLFPNKTSRVHYVPRGVIGSISAWNLPFSFFISDVVCALAAGNAVVVKASEVTPLVALKAKELCDAAGIPPELVQVVTGYAVAGAALYDAPERSARVDMIVFTGSECTGRRVGAACAERLIPCVLELGGNAAAIVCADVDVARAAESVVYGGFANAGQLCVSVNRVFVDDRIARAFTEKVVEITRKLRHGAGGEVDVGAITTPAQVNIIEQHVADAVHRGASIAAGGIRENGTGRFFSPTVLANVSPYAAVMREETFGPVIAIASFKTIQEAIRLANETPYGLMGYVFSRNRGQARQIARQIQAGTVIVNDVIYTYGVPETPWGGVKQSGIGRVHGDQVLKDMCEARHINEERFHIRMPWSYPYREAAAQRFLSLARWMYRLVGMLP
jgi:succinate-semialdehyde dehydrogenase/glutarate-semialdehyde dehydrogenase